MSEKFIKSESLEEQLKLIESVVNQEKDDYNAEAHVAWLEESLKFCIKEIRDLSDENDSVWDMIEEIRAAEIANHSEEFRQMMDRKLAEIKILAAMKPGQA